MKTLKHIVVVVMMKKKVIKVVKHATGCNECMMAENICCDVGKFTLPKIQLYHDMKLVYEISGMT